MGATVMAPALRGAAPRPRRDADRRGGVVEPPRPLRLTRRGRAVVWGLGAALAVAVGGAALSAQADGPVSRAVEVQRVVVASGDTLWGIAAEVAAPGEDVRDVVLRLMELNRLPSGGLQAGQTIVVPVG
ncbi:Peptidoglycan-binding lysin domain protein [Cellulomonas flavigena DSM 20109]|uniref:Peptidoglycan-binding lysin domain protein n=1 Tax=Cellulomonas flavigena (strain ATCC 482 / DSM 20109 / BCRC 11376 / JCM 18109 / NBRC 3775 / NCIMB 8073 / NRS 134) TaxID=446466 RepID=D5UDQ8_CELFN|nr:LysM peptidoglycan-binding domain-containing protein [Cellulomonas flavigena]ADG74466.1 Peptidoglycan-binding lysin domain protein [Cellulomonas flavigena DSM 20109]